MAKRKTKRSSCPCRPQRRRGGLGVISIGGGRSCPRAGTKLEFDPNPVSLALYSGRTPKRGEIGEVVTVPIPGGRKTCMPGPGGGLVYVKWPSIGTMGVSSLDVSKVKKGGR